MTGIAGDFETAPLFKSYYTEASIHRGLRDLRTLTTENNNLRSGVSLFKIKSAQICQYVFTKSNNAL